MCLRREKCFGKCNQNGRHARNSPNNSSCLQIISFFIWFWCYVKDSAECDPSECSAVRIFDERYQLPNVRVKRNILRALELFERLNTSCDQRFEDGSHRLGFGAIVTGSAEIRCITICHIIDIRIQRFECRRSLVI